MKLCKKLLLSLALCFFANAQAKVYPLPADQSDMIGKIQTVVTTKGDTFYKFAEKYNVGYYELVRSNPYVNPENPLPGTVVIIPSQYILPSGPREGIVINLAEMRLYYFPKDKNEVWTFPVGIGRKGSQTPLGNMTVVEHMDHPTWHSPESIRIERAKEGVHIPKVVPPGPDNPLGEYALRLSKRTYLIHGTNDNSGVGRRSSSGCIRMFPQDIYKLFNATKNGESVLVVSEPYKLAMNKNQVYLESYLPLKDNAALTAQLASRISQYVKDHGGYVKNSESLKKTLNTATAQQGLPQRIGDI